MKKTLITIAAVLSLSGLFGLVLPSTNALALTPGECGCSAGNNWKSTTGGTKCQAFCGVCASNPDSCAADAKGLAAIVKDVINVLLFIIGAVSVVMIIYGGFRYVTSAGNSDSVTKAKNTILYAVVGLVVALLAFAIVNFVITNL